MDLLHKLRTLVVAWVRQPFAPRAGRPVPAEDTSHMAATDRRPDGSSVDKQGASAEDTERVADLIQRRQSAE